MGLCYLYINTLNNRNTSKQLLYNGNMKNSHYYNTPKNGSKKLKS